jgi:hypothetical protein
LEKIVETIFSIPRLRLRRQKAWFFAACFVA